MWPPEITPVPPSASQERAAVTSSATSPVVATVPRSSAWAIDPANERRLRVITTMPRTSSASTMAPMATRIRAFHEASATRTSA